MSDFPMGYHITFGTYGTRLHGDERGTVHRVRNRPGEPIIGANDQWESMNRALLKLPPVFLDESERRFVEQTLPRVCERGGWRHMISAAQGDHVHALVTADVDGKAVRRWMKTWLTQAMNERWPRHGTWWAECGSVKWVWDRGYFERVHAYIAKQRTTTSDH